MSDNRLWNPAWGPDMSSPRDLTRDRAERSDMSGLGADMFRITLWNPDKELDKAGWNLAAEELGKPRIRKRLRQFWTGGWTCPAKLSGIWSETRISLA
jgi:hypothetical protein